MADNRSAETVLEEWREAERRAGGAVEGSSDAIRWRALVDALRDEYQALVDAALDEDETRAQAFPSS